MLPSPRHRAAVRAAALVVAIAAAAIGATVLVSGGLSVRIVGVTLRAHDATRPLVIAIASLAVHLALGGGLIRWLVSAWRTLERDPRWHSAIAVLLAAATLVFGIAYNTTAVGGADSYGYASEAELFLAHDVVMRQPWARDVPWPNATYTFTPLGYHPSPRADSPTVSAPTYSPGLPLLMAVAKVFGGQEGLFWVVPLFGALLVLGTYGVGRQLASSAAGLAGAWLMATSPAMLFMLVQPMSDVPAAGAWAAAFYWFLRRERQSALLAGVCAGCALLVRPNLVFGAAFMGLAYLLPRREWRQSALPDTLAFAAGAAPFAILVAALNQIWAGSPLESGYGSLGQYFATAHFLPNAATYLRELKESQTVVAVAGLVALAVPLKPLWPGPADRRRLMALAGFAFTLWLMYCFYLEYTYWWVLRFLLPAWPLMMAGVGAITASISRRGSTLVRIVAAIAILALGGYQLRRAQGYHIFEWWQGDRHYPGIARLVAEMTPPRSIIFAGQHSGSLRYYAGRLTIRPDLLDAGWLDRTLAWMTQHGVHPYLLAEEYEIDGLRTRFAGQHSAALLDRPPILTYYAPVPVTLFDLAPSGDQPSRVVHETYQGLRSVPPAAPPSLTWDGR